MITINIDKVDYLGPEDWSEISLDLAAEISAIDLPDILKEVYQVMTEQDQAKREDLINSVWTKATDEDLMRILPIYYGKIIQLIYKVPEDVMDRVLWTDRTFFYQKYCQSYVIDLHLVYPISYKSRAVDRITFKDEEYLFPTDLKILGNVVPMYKEQAVTFVEASDIMLRITRLQEIGIDGFAYIMALYCRKEGEQYEEERTLERAELMRSVPMSDVWEVFFCIIRLLNISLKHIRTYLRDHPEVMQDEVIRPLENLDKDL